MKENKSELLMSYIKSNVAPILINCIGDLDLPNSVVLPANCKKEELNGHYENDNFLLPSWYNELLKFNSYSILIIDKIDTISKNEQVNFIEILKHRQISTFKLPQNTIIIVTANKINKDTINEEIYSLVAHIKG